jgi:PAS domain S-box-containing protein
VPTSDGLRQLLGSGAVVKLGNHGGRVWTDLKTIVPPPPMAASGAAEYTLPDGSRRLGANVPIAGSPWAIATEFPREVAVAPARAFLTRALLIALACILLATIGAHLLSRRITSPLHELTAAAEAISAGDYSHPVAAGRGDEIGRLGVAFNAMLGQVRAGRRDLEQRVAERVGELEAAREETDRFFSLALDLLCIADGSHLKRVNPAWQKVLGWSPDELTSRSYLEFVHPEDIASTERETARLSGSLPLVSFANRYRCKDGTYRWLEWKAARAGKTGLIFAAARDITEQRRAADSQATHIGELAALNQELEAFSYSVSHDLRAPLRHVTGFAALLDAHASATLDEKGRRYLTTITAAASRMGRLIDDLLTFSRMGRTPLAKRRVPLDDLVQDVRREVSAGLDEGKIEWNIRPLPIVEADPSMLRLAMINLLSNAVKYSSPRTPAHIEVGTNGHHGNGDETVFFVRDNGVGFDMQYAPKLFGVFQRLHGADEFEGTGIGLANVRRIIQRHGGRVWAEAEVDRGATFFVSLPGKVASDCRRSHDPAGRGQRQRRRADAGGPAREQSDQPGGRRPRRIGSPRLPAPAQPVRRPGHGKSRAVPARLKMPKVDGIEVLRAVKSDARFRTIPVVVLTSSREEQDLVHSYNLGVNAYVVKPVAFQDFVQAVKLLGGFWAILNEPPPARVA